MELSEIEGLKAQVAKLAQAAAADLSSYKAAIERLDENLRASYEKTKEIAEMVNRHEREIADCQILITKLVKRVFGDPTAPPSPSKPQPN